MSGKLSAPPWDFFHDASITSLQSFELSRLNHAANLRREIAALLDQWVSDNSEAMLARWVREHRTLVRPIQPDAIAGAEVDPFPAAIAGKHVPTAIGKQAPAAIKPVPAATVGKPSRQNLALEEHPHPELEAQSLLTFEPVPAVPVVKPRPTQQVQPGSPEQTPASAPPRPAIAPQTLQVQARSRRPR